jgi:hypothetical protein
MRTHEKQRPRPGCGAGATITSGERDKGQAIAIAACRLRLRHQPTKGKRESTEPNSGNAPGSGVAETLLSVRLSIKAPKLSTTPGTPLRATGISRSWTEPTFRGLAIAQPERSDKLIDYID